jgi:hypothetical protein
LKAPATNRCLNYLPQELLSVKRNEVAWFTVDSLHLYIYDSQYLGIYKADRLTTWFYHELSEQKNIRKNPTPSFHFFRIPSFPHFKRY